MAADDLSTEMRLRRHLPEHALGGKCRRLDFDCRVDHKRLYATLVLELCPYLTIDAASTQLDVAYLFSGLCTDTKPVLAIATPNTPERLGCCAV